MLPKVVVVGNTILIKKLHGFRFSDAKIHLIIILLIPFIIHYFRLSLHPKKQQLCHLFPF